MRIEFDHPLFKTIAESADELNTDCYVIGGWVRDQFLNRPSKDIDIVAIGSGIALAEAVAKKLGSNCTVSFFKNFGTAQLKFEDLEVEFVGARRESYRSASRKPIVEDGSLDDDQKRRDFTVNALAFSLNKADYGALLDPFNGLDDLQKKILRTPLAPEETFSDDPLRMMRAIRFATQLGFEIDPAAYHAIAATKDRIHIVSKERITDELNKIILAPHPSVGFKLLNDTGLLDLIFPQMGLLRGVETIAGKSHKDNFYHTLQVLDNITRSTSYAANCSTNNIPSCTIITI